MKITIETEELYEARQMLRAGSTMGELFEYDQWLRSEIKYNHENTNDMIIAYEKARIKLNELIPYIDE